MDSWRYTPKTEKQLRNWYNSKVKKGKIDFVDFQELLQWYQREKVCYYCGIREETVQELVHKGIITSIRFPQNGKMERGKCRGYHLEIERKHPGNLYSSENCELSCYFCNNDKSDIFTASEYTSFFQDRANYLINLLKANDTN